MLWLSQELVALQREIYLAFADRSGSFAATGNRSQLAAYLPMGFLFGAVHAIGSNRVVNHWARVRLQWIKLVLLHPQFRLLIGPAGG